MGKIRLQLDPIYLSISTSIFLLTSLFFLLHIQPAISQRKPTQQGLWNRIFQPNRNPKPPIKPVKGGSRPSQAICMVSPDAPPEPRIVWNTQPLFIWDNGGGQANKVNPLLTVKKIAVAVADKETNSRTNSVNKTPNYLSTQIVTGKTSTLYAGSPLKPGQTYTWFVFLSETNANPMMQVSFRIMDAKQRDRITQELRLLEKLQQNQKATPEAIALAKAKYFAEKQFWSDAIQQAYSVANPSQELAQLREELPKYLCRSVATR